MFPEFNMSQFEDRHASTKHILSLFDYNHLPQHLEVIAASCWFLAVDLCNQLKDGPELTVALRKLLEAKDGFVRQCVIDNR